MKKELIEQNVILKLTFNFSLRMIEYCEILNAHKKFVIGKQLLRSATSIGANAMEAQNAESKADFIHKMKISAKEAEETQYWLWLCESSKEYPQTGQLLNEIEEIQKVLNRILKTSKKKNPLVHFLTGFNY